ncbi:hypothetical protein IM543_11190 [Massilia sp. UMI-21]|nr:hypothetical protein IM543_11190 [Massilia sp. UMI-21]
MIVVDPVTMGDAAFARASSATYWDRDGVLRTAGPNELRVTYDPTDLSKPPYALVEAAATNILSRSNQFSFSNVWKAGTNGALSEGTVAWVDGSMTASAYTHATSTGNFAYLSQIAADPADASLDWVYSLWVKVPSGTATINLAISNVSLATKVGAVEAVGTTWRRLSFALAAGQLANTGLIGVGLFGTPGQVYHIYGAQLERGNRPSFCIPTFASAVTRAADVISSTAGLLYSNVAEPEPLWAAGTYALGAKVRDAAHVAYESLAAANTAPLTDASKWLKLGATNRYAMFDDRNNTQTSNAEEVTVVLSPRAIAQGLLLGNLDATEIGISVVVPNFGVVYRETASLVVSTSNSSFFRWGFNRIRRRTLFLSLSLPIFFNGVVTVSIRKPGGIARCGMCLIGPIVEPGPTLIGLSTEIKDYSTTLFNTDGSSSTVERGYRKLMSMDVSIDTEKIVEAEEQMIAWKQKTVAWIGAASRPDTVLVGRYSSFKKVIESYPRSKMALQIEGVLS